MSRHDRTRLSMRDLIAEAERREIAGAEWMDRATLVRALEERDGEGALGPLARARRFLGQVTGLGRVAKVVRGAIDPARPDAPSLVTERAQPSVSAEPVEIAREHVSEGAVVDAIAANDLPIVSEPAPSAPPPMEIAVPASSELLAGDPSFGGMRVVNRNGRAWLVWRAPGARMAAIGGGSELTLRMVSVGCEIGEPDAEVVVETADESGVALEGVRALPDTHGRQCVAAIGVGRGNAFVAVAHARVA